MVFQKGWRCEAQAATCMALVLWEPESAGRFVDTGGYIRAGACSRMCGCIPWAPSAEPGKRCLAGDNCSWACSCISGTRAVSISSSSHTEQSNQTRHCLHPVFGKDAEWRGLEGKFLRLSSEQHFSSPVLVRAESEESDPLGPLGSQPFQAKCQLILTLQWTRNQTPCLPQSQNKQDILWTGADQTLWKHQSPGTQLMPLKMTCLPSVWLLVLSSADEDGCNQGSNPWWATKDIKSEAIFHNLMVSTVQFLALKKAKAEKFLDVVSYQFVTGLCQR